jgi:hypothetical protein
MLLDLFTSNIDCISRELLAYKILPEAKQFKAGFNFAALHDCILDFFIN